MVARGAGAAGPVLLACRQWDPRGLARRLPSLGAGACHGAPLLPWRVQCPVHVCAALAAGSGGLGRCKVSCLPRFPLPAPRFLRCVWRAVLSGCPLSSLAGTSFHAVCAFRGLGPVALLVFPACPLCVCALALPRRPRPPPLPWFVWRAHLARSRCWVLVGPFHAVRAPPPVLPRSRAPFGLLRGGGAARSRFPPTWLGAVCSPWVGAARLGRSSAGGWGGWGGGLCAVLPNCGAGGASGAGCRLASVRPSAFPGQATKMVSLALLWPWRAWPPYCSGSCWLAVSGRDPCGALVCWRGFACPTRFLQEQAARALRRALLRPPSRAPRSCRGEGGSAPLPRGGLGGRRPRGLRVGGEGGGTGGGGSRRGSPPSPSGGGGLRPSAQSPFRRRRIPPRCTRLVGVVGQPRAPAAACRRRASLAGGGGGGAAREPPPRRGGWRAGGPGGRSASAPPSALPGRATMRASLPTLRSLGAWPPYCSGSLSRAAPGQGPATFLCAGAGSPACCDPRGSRRWGARGRAACGSS